MDVLEKSLKIRAMYLCMGKELPNLRFEHMVDLHTHILSIVRHSAIGNVELPFRIIAEHGAIAVFPNEIEIRGLVGLGTVADSLQIDIVMDLAEIHIVTAGETSNQVFSKIIAGKGIISIIV